MNGHGIGLALGGGGVRGFAHAGVLEILEREDIPIELIVGTSFGSVVGGMFAARPGIDRLHEKLKDFLSDPMFEKTRMDILRGSLAEGRKLRLIRQLKDYARRGVLYGMSFSRGYFISADEFRRTLGRLIEDIEIARTRIPFRCVATDLVRGCSVTIGQGSLITAVQASCSLPGVFQPVREGRALLVDGGWSGPVPAPQAREAGAGCVVAVDTSESGHFSGEGATGLQLITRSQDVTKRELADWMVRKADVVIRPQIGHIHWTEFGRAAECVDRGREAAIGSVSSIRKALEKSESGNLADRREERGGV